MLADYMRKNPPKAGSDIEAAWLYLQGLPPEERDAVTNLVESLYLEVPEAGLYTALEVIWKVGLLWARRVLLDNHAELW